MSTDLTACLHVVQKLFSTASKLAHSLQKVQAY